MRILIRNNVDRILWTNICIVVAVSVTTVFCYLFMPADIWVSALPAAIGTAVFLAGTMGGFAATQLMLAQRNHIALRKILDYDPLTNVLTRTRFFTHLKRYDEIGGVVAMIDIDHFKRVNDTYGHAAGDEVLQFVGGQLVGATRRGDLVARYGGEEFAAFFPATDREEAEALAERLRKRLALGVVEFEGQRLSVTASIGLAEVMPSHDPLTALQLADDALYVAKRSGRNKVVMAPRAGPFDMDGEFAEDAQAAQVAEIDQLVPGRSLAG